MPIIAVYLFCFPTFCIGPTPRRSLPRRQPALATVPRCNHGGACPGDNRHWRPCPGATTAEPAQATTGTGDRAQVQPRRSLPRRQPALATVPRCNHGGACPTIADHYRLISRLPFPFVPLSMPNETRRLASGFRRPSVFYFSGSQVA